MIGGIQASGGTHARPTAQDIFKKLDKNGDGSLDADELSAAKSKNGKGPDASRIMALADADKDGKISAAENDAAFAKMKGGHHHHGGHKADGQSGQSQPAVNYDASGTPAPAETQGTVDVQA
jgi:hypothetical protein